MNDPENDQSSTVEESGWVQAGLVVLSVVSIAAAGIYAGGADPWKGETLDAGVLRGALLYTVFLVGIIGAHEAGHYFTGRRVGIPVSRPYFLPGLGPLPALGVIPFFGTFGAFIKMGWRKVTSGELIAVAGWGPIAGFVPTAMAVFLGIYLSKPTVVEGEDLMLLGDSLMMIMATELFHPDLGASEELFLHPIGLAGWVGCLLTALNLLPIGQLDGGHLSYAYLREKAVLVSWTAFAALMVAGILLFPGWFILGGLIAWLGLKHPPMVDDEAEARQGSNNHWITALCVVIFVLTFSPEPVKVDALPQWIETLWEL